MDKSIWFKSVDLGELNALHGADKTIAHRCWPCGGVLDPRQRTTQYVVVQPV
ncbi:MAG TPA: hypothetical protein VGS12_01790 [Caulobacteraceae bacterium]|nr:hypothetical protein [Caulobacteraceae bacterium]